MQVCDKLYGKIHHKNGKANAFRHALWNVLICEKTLKFTKNGQKSAEWAKKVTDLHEKLAKNDELDTEMDFHNNEIGRRLFLAKKDQNESISNEFLLKMLENAQKVVKIEDFEKIDNQLVYILE